MKKLYFWTDKIVVQKVEARDKRIWLFGVFSACPLKEALEGCLFKEYRKMSPLERWECINRLSDDEVDSLILRHKNCLYKRESGELSKCPAAPGLKKTG